MGTKRGVSNHVLGLVAVLSIASGCRSSLPDVGQKNETRMVSPIVNAAPVVTPAPAPTWTPSPTPTPTPTVPVPTERAALVAEPVTVLFLKARDNDPMMVTVRNSSAISATGLRVGLTSLGSAFLLLSNDCEGAQLAQNETCELVIDFANPEEDAQTGALTITYEDAIGARPWLQISLQGPGMALDSIAQMQRSNRACGNKAIADVCAYGTPSTFDGANCLAGWAPGGKRAYFANGEFLYAPSAGVPCAAGDYFNGTKCVFAQNVQGKLPFVKFDTARQQWGFYFKPSTRTVETYYQGQCPRGSVFDGRRCYVATAPRGVASVDYVEDREGMLRHIFRYPAAAGTPCVEADYYDAKKCQLIAVPNGWHGLVVGETDLYITAKNVSCVE